MKRIAELRDLSDDHHTALVLAQRCREASASGAAELWQRVREAFRLELEPHFQIEDRHLLPALEAIGESDRARRIRDDHAALREIAANDAPAVGEIARFGDLLASHVRFEEREVFERTQHRLPRAALDAIAAACRAMRTPAPSREAPPAR